MPAAAVIPAPIAYIKVVAVKKLVVGFRGPRPFPALGVVLVQFAGPGVSVAGVRRARPVRSAERRALPGGSMCSRRLRLLLIAAVGEFGTFTLNKLECSKQAGRFEYVSME